MPELQIEKSKSIEPISQKDIDRTIREAEAAGFDLTKCKFPKEVRLSGLVELDKKLAAEQKKGLSPDVDRPLERSFFSRLSGQIFRKAPAGANISGSNHDS